MDHVTSSAHETSTGEASDLRADPPTSTVDVVIVSFNSAGELREAAAPLAGRKGIHVIVVDNASDDGSLMRVVDLDVTAIQRLTNDGFAAGCNAGWRAGGGPYVCFLNPDAILDAPDLWRLVELLESDLRVGVVAPRIEEADGTLVHSLRRFPRIGSTFARAFYLHRVFPRARWADDLIRDDAAYARPASPEWVSGACLVIRREALEAVHGWDEGFFLYGEDIDLCRRIREAGWTIRFDPSATARHLGGRSAPRAGLLPVLTRSRLRYARKHGNAGFAMSVRIGLVLGASTHALVGRGGAHARRGHLAALAVALGLSRRDPL
jgi:N-acetylglucosaminyl-diphospho-decaprenol L-rhamnosyltransferase